MSMLNPTTEPVLRNARAALKRAGINELPAGLVEQLDALAKIDASAFALGGKADGLIDAVSAALSAGNDPAKDTTVIDELTRHQLAHAIGWEAALTDRRDRALLEILHEWAPRLFTEWRAHVATAGKRLAAAAQHLNLSTTLDGQSGAVLRAGGKQSSAWHDAHTAVVVIDNVMDAQRSLLRLVDPRARVVKVLLACPEMTHDEYASLPINPQGQGEPMADAWTLACQGHTITGVDYEGYQAARARHNGELKDAIEAEQRKQEESRIAFLRNR